MEAVTVYTISDKATGYVYYVGATMYPLKTRLSQHMSSPSKGMAFMTTGEIDPVIEPLEIVDECDAKDRESYWISQMRQWGFQLRNDRCYQPYNYKRVRYISDDPRNIRIQSTVVPFEWIKKPLKMAHAFGGNHPTAYIAKMARRLSDILEITGKPGPRLTLTPDKVERLQDYLREMRGLYS